MSVVAQPGQQITKTETLRVLQCGECQVIFAMPQALYDRAFGREHGTRAFWCPNGCRLIAIGPSPAELAERKLAAERAQHDQTRASLSNAREQVTHREHQLRGTKAALTRVKNRVKRGVCPCCDRYFEQLDRHMHDQHPEYVQSSDETEPANG